MWAGGGKWELKASLKAAYKIDPNGGQLRLISTSATENTFFCLLRLHLRIADRSGSPADDGDDLERQSLMALHMRPAMLSDSHPRSRWAPITGAMITKYTLHEPFQKWLAAMKQSISQTRESVNSKHLAAPEAVILHIRPNNLLPSAYTVSHRNRIAS